jgi:hypothetical protein
VDRSEIDRWTAAGAQEIAPMDWRQAEREALRGELVDARRQRDALVVAATQAIDALRSGHVLDWSVRDRVIAALAAAVGEER